MQGGATWSGRKTHLQKGSEKWRESARAIEMTLFVLASALSIIIHLMRSLCAFLFI